MLDPSMQIFHLTDICNNACLFCICKKHLQEKKGDSPAIIREKLRGIQENGIIDIFGGEPTLSKAFMEIIRQAKQKQCFINIATNARTFSQKNFFEQFLKETGDYKDKVFIRSSLHGHTATIHDLHTRRKHSFLETIKGIEQLKQAGYRVSTNTVVTGLNYQHLGEIHELIERLQVDVFKISFMRHTLQNANLAVTLNDLKAHLPMVLEQAARSQMTIDLDSIPYCVAPSQLALYIKEEDKFIDSDNRLVKADKCNACAMVGMCPGVDREYFELFGGDELEPIARHSLDPSIATLVHIP